MFSKSLGAQCTHTHTHTHIYIYIRFICVVCVCVCNCWRRAMHFSDMSTKTLCTCISVVWAPSWILLSSSYGRGAQRFCWWEKKHFELMHMMHHFYKHIQISFELWLPEIERCFCALHLYYNKDENNSPKTLDDKNHQALTQKFIQLHQKDLSKCINQKKKN